MQTFCRRFAQRFFPVLAIGQPTNTAAVAAKGSETIRNAQLDFLRGIAILLVVGFHITARPEQTAWEKALFAPVMYTGWVGVTLFFVLSGYLVSGLLFSEYKRTGKCDIKRFLVRRGWKIYPAYYIYLLFIALITITHIDWKSFGYSAIFIQNYTGMPGIFPPYSLHTWSLAVEEHFYLALAVTIYLLLKVGKLKYIPTICICVMIMSLVCRLFVWNSIATHLRGDALAFGVYLSWMKHFVPDRLARFCQFGPNKIWTAALIIMGVVYKPFDYAAGHVFGTTFAYLGFGALLILMVEQTWQGKYASELVRRIGIYSYSIYLWHEIVKQGVHAVWHGSLLIEVALYAPLAIGVGIAMAKLIECPMLRLREIVAK